MRLCFLLHGCSILVFQHIRCLNEDKAKEILLEDEIEILVKLGDGNASAEADFDILVDIGKRMNGNIRSDPGFFIYIR